MKRTGFADRVRGLRKQNGWSQQELANRCGCGQSAISAIEVERRGATIDLIIKLAEAFKTTTDYLLTGVQP